MYATLSLGLAVSLSAPTIKDPPKKDATIIGEWALASMTHSGTRMTINAGFRLEVTTDGLWISRIECPRPAPPDQRNYKVDAKADPPTIDLVSAEKQSDELSPRPILGIYKVEGDTLTVCYNLGANDRPTKFESPDGSRIVLMVLKRVKKKE